METISSTSAIQNKLHFLRFFLLIIFTASCSLVTFGQHPGGVPGSTLWLKANDGTTNTGSNLNTWIDKAALPNTFTKTGVLGYTVNSLNFNPAVSIVNTGGQPTALPVNRLDGSLPITYVDGFAVYKSNTNTSCLIGSVVSGASYGVGIFNADGSNEVMVSNGSSSAHSQFNNPNLTLVNIANLDVNLGVTPFATGRLNGVTETLSHSGGAPYSSIVFTPMIGGSNNNGNSNGWYPFDGEVAEIILFPASLSGAEKQKIESYLAIKYGITLGSVGAPVDYISSSGTTVWSADVNFQWNVFGIGRDDASGLNQSTSNSFNTGSGSGVGQSGKGNVILSNPATLDNGEFLMVGSNNDPLTRFTLDLPLAYANRYRVKREWKALHTGDVGDVTVSFDVTGLSVNGTQASDYFILIDDDGNGDFSNTTAYPATTFAANVATFENVFFSMNAVFTFITGLQPAGPAGIFGPSLWIKANDGALASGSNLNTWEDKANLNTFTKVGNVGFTSNSINYNPSVSFTNNNAAGDNTSLPANRLDGNEPVEYIDGFAVFKSNRQLSGPANGHTAGSFYTVVGSTVPGNLYGAGIFTGDFDQGRVYSGNGSHEFYQYYSYSDYNNYNITNIDVSLATDPFATGRLNGITQSMAYDGPNDFSSITVTPMIGGTNNNGYSEGFYALNGDIAEVVLYPKSLSLGDKAKIESYLAIKYGISLGNNTNAVAYVSSSGSTIWNADPIFKYDVFGIGKDDASQLNQTASNSYNTGGGNGTGQLGKGNIVISTPSSLDNGDFLVVGHNNDLLTITTSDLPVIYNGNNRLLREWKAQLTGSVGTISIGFDLNGIQYTGTLSNQFYLLIDTDGDGDFSNATAQAASSFSGGIANFTNVTLPNNALFTFMTGPEILGPGGVKGPSLWLKANDGATNSGANLNSWEDKASANNVLNSLGTVNYTTNALNFNSAIAIDNTGGTSAVLPNNRIDGTVAIPYVDGFAVYKSGSTFSTLLGSTVAGQDYGPGIFAGDDSSPRVYVANGSHSTRQYFNNSELSSYNIANLDISSTISPFATGRLNGLNKNIHTSTNDFNSIMITPMVGGTNNKGENDGLLPFTGEVAEIVLFPSSLSPADKLKVESYLALKYGISLDTSVAQYVNSSGTPIWNNLTYWNDVFGIGKDDNSSLNQIRSNSIRTGNGDGSGQFAKGNIVISNPSSLNNGDFLIVGHDNFSLTQYTQGLPAPYQEFQRVKRSWLTKMTGVVGTVDMTFDLNGIPHLGVSAADFVLLLDADADGNYSNAAQVVASSFVGGVATFTNVSLSDGMLFTFITGPQLVGPGGVKGPSLWLKANDGVVQSTGNLTDWVDKAAVNDFSATVGSIGFSQNILNFNPAATIDNSGGTPNTLPLNRLEGNFPVDFVEGFAVYQSDTTLYTLLGSTQVGNNYGPGVFVGDNTTNPRVYAGNGTSSTYQYFANPNLDKFSIANLDVSTSVSPFATGRLNGLNTTIQTGSGGDFNSITVTPMLGGTNNNGNSNGFYPFAGKVSEIVLFPKGLSLTEKLKVESYLALKYGITLDVSSGQYLNASGTSLWSNSTYWNDVFGIGNDAISGLNQSISNSFNSGSGDGTGQSGKGNIVLSNPSSLNDNDFLLIGHDNTPLLEQTTDLPLSQAGNKRLTREWKVSRINDVGTVDLSFDTSGLCLSFASAAHVKLLIDIDGDGDFSNAASTVTASSISASKIHFINVLLPHGAVFTVMSEPVQLSLTTAAGTTSQTICVNSSLSNIVYAVANATNANVSGLPAGVSAAFSAGVLTINGTPTQSGTFNYTVTPVGPLCVVIPNLTGTISVTPANAASAASSAPTLCANAGLTAITHTTTGATGIGTPTGLPAGVTASWNANTITISGTPTASGTFNYSIPLTGGCDAVNASGTITVSPNNTVSAASSAPTICANTALTAITHTTTGATGIGAATGLPAGVTASWNANTITISGTPTASGTFNYTIPLTGGCDAVNATGTITVSPNNTVSAASSAPTICANTALTAITHTTTGATGIGAATGLPAGVTASWNANTITISGTPTASGTFNYSIPLTGGCDAVNATGTITVSPNNTVSVASSAPTLCANTALTAITHTTTGATGIGTPTGLPAGVTASWNANTITISGTPTASGTFNYTIPLTGGCDAVNATGVIEVIQTPAPSGNPVQVFSVAQASDATVADLVVTGTNIVWYSSLNDALAQTNPLSSGTQLVTGSTYYAVSVENGCYSAPFEVSVTVYLGYELWNKEELSIYPNPTTGDFKIDFSTMQTDITVRVHSVTGQLIEAYNFTNKQSIELSLRGEPGMYTVEISSQGKILNTRLIKQ